MKKLTALLLTVLLISCTSSMQVTKGHNKFRIGGLISVQMNIPSQANTLRYDIELDSTWYSSEPLTDIGGYGVKLPGIGHWWNYHKVGVNFAIVKKKVGVIVYPRYYKNYQNWEGVEDGIYRIINPNETHHLRIDYVNKDDSVHWFIDGLPVYAERVDLEYLWINNYTPFIGTNGNQYTGRATAKRTLRMKLKFK